MLIRIDINLIQLYKMISGLLEKVDCLRSALVEHNSVVLILATTPVKNSSPKFSSFLNNNWGITYLV